MLVADHRHHIELAAHKLKLVGLVIVTRRHQEDAFFSDLVSPDDDLRCALAVPGGGPSAGNGKGTSQIVVGRYKITEKGVFLVTPGDDDKPDKFEFVCGKLDVVAMIRDKHSGQWGKLLQWEDPDCQSHEWATVSYTHLTLPTSDLV